MRCTDVIDKLNSDRTGLDEFGVKSIAVFGSVARDQATRASDVDILVDFSSKPGLFEFVELKEHLESLLNCRVDLVTPDALHPRLRDRILREAVYAR